MPSAKKHRPRPALLPVAASVLLAAFAFATAAMSSWAGQGDAPAAGALAVAPHLLRTLKFRAGRFAVIWDGRQGQLRVRCGASRSHLVFATPAHAAFLGAAVGAMNASGQLGYFAVRRVLAATYAGQTIAAVAERHGTVTIRGELAPAFGRPVPYMLALRPQGPAALAYHLRVGAPANRVYLDWASSPQEGYYGFGAQFSLLDMQGHVVPMLPQEHGYGRGRQPLTLLADLVDHGAGGHYYNTYAPVPFFLTSSMQALYSENTGYQAFNLTQGDIGQLEVDGREAHGLIFAGSTPAGLLRAYRVATGQAQDLPAWTQQGLIVAAEGGTRAVLAHLHALLGHGVKVTGLWIQDWSGLHRTSFGEQVVWNWRLDTSHYPHWRKLLAFLQRRRIKLLGYINPFLTDTGKPAGPQNLYLVAKARGYLVETARGVPYAFHYPGNTAYLLDLTDPGAVAWLQGIMRRQLIGNGFDGWMADFGEELPLDAKLAKGPSSVAAHDLYPVLWAHLNAQVLNASGRRGKDLVFLRSAFGGSQAYLPALWLGDQLESWGGENGLASSVTALLSAGLSGFPTAHGDMGGFTSLVQFPLHYVRTPELLMRWVEVDAFTSLMRGHEGNLPAKNAQLWSSPAVMGDLRRMVDLYEALAPYRSHLMQAAMRTDAPLDRPLFFNYPEDPRAYALGSREFMLGRDVLVAPVFGPGVRSLDVYLPQGDWREIWTGRAYRSSRGALVHVPSPLGQPAVFSREGTQAGRALARAVAQLRR